MWSKTALFITFDENDGFFDHLVPPTPPRTRADGLSTVDAGIEIYPGSAGNPVGPYGLGIRVPMIVVSPWSRGGLVCSEVFDHTFKTPNQSRIVLPDTSSYEPPDHERHPYVPTPPTAQALPVQERRVRRADGPRTYIVGAGKSLFDRWSAAPAAATTCRSTGPTASCARFAGSLSSPTNVDVDAILQITNLGRAACRVTVSNTYDNGAAFHRLRPGQSVREKWSLDDSFGWYDLVIAVDGDDRFRRRLAGHVENGRDSVSDPALGGVRRVSHLSRGVAVVSCRQGLRNRALAADASIARRAPVAHAGSLAAAIL